MSGGGSSIFGAPEGTGPGGKVTKRDLDRFAREFADALFGEMRRAERDRRPKRCPKCRSTGLVPIEYGIPINAMRRAAAQGEIVLGFAKRYPGAPTVECRQCGHRSGRVAAHRDEDFEPRRKKGR